MNAARLCLPFWLALIVLSGCAARAPLPTRPAQLDLPLQLHVQRQEDGQSQDWLLVIQGEGAALRWSLLDPLGIPLSRQRLLDGEWQNDGLLPPNAEARELFAALLFALTPADQLVRQYPQARTLDNQRLLDSRQPAWRVDFRQPLDFDLRVGTQLSYRINSLEATL
ncbi:hypothetical protein [Pseudomonas sp.]|uniref:hypothetical protein n=1 Tax=Pseudomonas sp. TaxID=306 RepID=UPI0028A84375|nr:hypothetical protein [Pseudomonas sp.]